MSLAAIANHMASKGRGPDSMLVHMSPKEVQGLQALAHATGGSLTTNPHTGLPEAGWLSTMLPTIIGVALAPATGGASLGLTEAWQTAALVGGAQALATGSIGKGLQAGLGAYGGASIGNSLANLGSSALSGEATSLAANEAAKEAGIEAVGSDALTKGLTTPEIEALQRQAIDEGGNAVSRVTPNSSAWENLKAGTASAANSPMKFLSENAKPLMYAAGPAILAGLNTKNNMPQTVTQPGKVTPYSYDPYSGEYTSAGAYEVPTKKAAGGGLMGMANNSGTGGMFDFTKDGSNEPVVRSMASGGIAHFADGGDAALAAYQAGDYGKAAEILGSSGMNAQDVVSKYGLSAADAATVAQNLGYTGNMSGLNYGTPAPAPAAQAPATDNWQPNLTPITPDANAPAAQTQTADNWQPNLTPITPGYNSFSNDQLSTFFADPKNVAALNTPGGLQALEAQYKADPAAIMKYLQGSNGLNLSAADTYQLGQGKGLQAVYDSGDQWVKAYPNASGEQIAQAMKDAGWNSKDVENYFNRSNSAYGTNQATGKAFTGAGDIYNIGQGKGFSDITSNIKQWIATYPKATLADAQAAMSASGLNELDVIRATGKTSAELYAAAKKTPVTVTGGTDLGTNTVTNTGTGASTGVNTQGGTALESATNLPPGVSGAGITTVNPNGTITTRPDLSLGMSNVRNAYTTKGGSLGFTPTVPKTIEDFEAKYNTQTGGSKAAYDYLTGKSPYPLKPSTPTGEVMKPYSESVLGMPVNVSKKRYLYDNATQQYKINPDYAIPTYDANGKKSYNVTNKDVAAYVAAKPSNTDFYNWAKTNNLTMEQIAAATGLPITEVQKMFTGGATAETTAKAAADAAAVSSATDTGGGGGDANGGLMKLAVGGMAAGGQFDLGGYSDGGRLLRGPGDGVSDSIPATIGGKRPARLADGEFVVPARIVSELGNGSTEAGARKLYAMMDRVQAARKGSIGKGKVANNSRADKYLPV